MFGIIPMSHQNVLAAGGVDQRNVIVIPGKLLLHNASVSAGSYTRVTIPAGILPSGCSAATFMCNGSVNSHIVPMSVDQEDRESSVFNSGWVGNENMRQTTCRIREESDGSYIADVYSSVSCTLTVYLSSAFMGHFFRAFESAINMGSFSSSGGLNYDMSGDLVGGDDMPEWALFHFIGPSNSERHVSVYGNGYDHDYYYHSGGVRRCIGVCPVGGDGVIRMLPDGFGTFQGSLIGYFKSSDLVMYLSRILTLPSSSDYTPTPPSDANPWDVPKEKVWAVNGSYSGTQNCHMVESGESWPIAQGSSHASNLGFNSEDGDYRRTSIISFLSLHGYIKDPEVSDAPAGEFPEIRDIRAALPSNSLIFPHLKRGDMVVCFTRKSSLPAAPAPEGMTPIIQFCGTENIRCLTVSYRVAEYDGETITVNQVSAQGNHWAYVVRGVGAIGASAGIEVPGSLQNTPIPEMNGLSDEPSLLIASNQANYNTWTTVSADAPYDAHPNTELIPTNGIAYCNKPAGVNSIPETNMQLETTALVVNVCVELIRGEWGQP